MHRAFLAFLAAAATAAAAQDDPAAIAERLTGTWVTPVIPFPLPGGTAYTRRTATITPDSESLLVEAFADEALTQPLLTYDSGGPMKIVGPWAPVEGAFAVELVNERSLVTLFVDDPALQAAVNLGACEMAVGVAVDISGCSEGPPFQVVDCVDLDLVFLSEGDRRLQFGGEGFDRCEERPTTLAEVAFVRE